MENTLTGSINHCFAEAAGIRFHYVVNGKGPTVVLIAGFPQSCYAWRRIIPLLATQYKVIAIDLPGQGDSDKPVDGYDTKKTAERVHALLDKLGETSYVFIGHDIGSWVGYPFAHTYPDCLRGLVLIDGNIPGVTLQPTITLGPDNWRNWHFLFNQISDLPEILFQGRERILIEWFFNHKTANFLTTFNKADIDEYERVYSGLGGMRGMLGYYRAVLQDIEQNEALKKVMLSIPVLALGGDTGSAPDIYERMKPLAHLVYGGVIKNSGHYIPEEQPAALAQEIVCFIDKLPS
jgi:pimeloyl-ACP methyl ester carboxylesterase